MLHLSLALALALPAHARRKKAQAAPDLEQTAAALFGQALASDEAWRELTFLADQIGHRLSGTPELEEAIRWAADEMRADGLEVTLEPVEVNHWVRGRQHAALVSPRVQPLEILTLGDSVATPQGGLTADVLVVSSFEELTARKAQAEGRIILWDVPFTTYGETVAYRGRGATEAARVGGVASLVRSVGPISLHTPHTGNQWYGNDVTKVPAAAVTVEVASWLHRLQDAGVTPRIHLDLQPESRPPARSHNVVGELKGRDLPNEIVLIGCHIDAWDVGQGAQDDGAGCTNVMEVGRLLAALPVAPRRTVRVVLFTNEENGLGGARAYAQAHSGEAIVAVMEDDSGAGEPLGFSVDVRSASGERDAARTQAVINTLRPLLHPLGTLGATTLEPGGSGADVGQLVPGGAVGFGLRHNMDGYWPIHHTDADTLDKIDPMAVRRNTAAAVVLTWVLAELPQPLHTLQAP